MEQSPPVADVRQQNDDVMQGNFSSPLLGNDIWTQGCGFKDFSAASAAASTKNVVILSVAISPTSAEALDPANRFRFRFSVWTETIHSCSSCKSLGYFEKMVTFLIFLCVTPGT